MLAPNAQINLETRDLMTEDGYPLKLLSFDEVMFFHNKFGHIPVGCWSTGWTTFETKDSDCFTRGIWPNRRLSDLKKTNVDFLAGVHSKKTAVIIAREDYEKYFQSTNEFGPVSP